VAEAEGYQLRFGCVSGPDDGAMGLHYVNMPLVVDLELDARRPEIVIYEPQPDGGRRLIGADYLVLADEWHAQYTDAPQLMGQLMHRIDSPNRYGLPSFYTLHVWAWKPNPNGAFVNWHANATWSTAIGWSVMGCGVLVLLWATFLIDHFELLGLRQGWSTLRGAELRAPTFVTPHLYKLVRHPQYLGWLLIFWGTPTMTSGHLLFATSMSGYILLAMRFEERDLVQHIGEPYERYRQQVPALVPQLGRRLGKTEEAASD